MSLIECRQLTRTYRRGSEEITPLRDLNLDIEAGGFVALMGPSGSGKTTLLNLLAGIDRPTSGTLSIAGDPVHTLSRGALARWRSTHVGYIFQLYNLIPVLTAYENVELPLLLHSLSRSERHDRVSEALESVGIEDRYAHYPRQLSGGQEQRVAIARAIVTKPTILLADEPTGDLDRESATSVMDLLAQLNSEQGRTIVMVTHDPRTTGWADTVLHLEKGQLIEHTIGETA
ncbi:MAG: ABC transporter ATP-binding protein [Phycisphaerae bacterium]|jgi:putative ABC transport system ATP-binding protein|nr:ABC transporter ATP-binding protein [Phycisphaerae bacterium]MBT5381914.1 ABC transporter ATP-binding protein [Phycisphaerae bacterium]MBT5583207.1 ABC transporter ATP-binding protein [Phycisphaerae bacterium]MBT5657496.1 ABC transporter ATP-binding protein [Phycisphaerae bacterium]MBT7352295.1 ABC transporter ATP-binding protein [Phycisphaerae bacterium]